MFGSSIQAQLHSSQYNLCLDAVDYIAQHGLAFHRARAVFYFLRNCDIPFSHQQFPQITQLAGTAVVLPKDQKTIITIRQNQKKGLKHFRCNAIYFTTNNSSILYL
jgi:hypothetical protein